MTDTQGTIEASQAQIHEIIEETSVGYHEKIYANIDDGRVRFLAGTPGGSVVAFTDYIEGEIESIEGDAQAVIPVPDLLDYLDVAADGTSSTLELEFVGSADTMLAEQLRMSPAGSHSFNVGLTLPASDTTMENVPTDLPSLFDDDNVLINQAEERPVGTHIETYIETLDKVRDVIDLREEMNYYPIVVDEGDFLLDVGSERGNYVEAELQGEAEGEDVDNLYGSGYEEVVKTLDGQITLHTEQNSPMLLLQEQSYGTIRHVLGDAE